MQFPENSSSGEHGSWEGLRQHQPEVEGWEGSARGGGSMLEVREEARVAAAATRQGAGVSQVGDSLGLVVTRRSFSF